MADGGAVFGDTMAVQTFVGGGGADTKVTFTNFSPPRGVLLAPDGTIFVADFKDNRVAKINR